MSKIRILPEQIANRIAAGEVVERPASVIKELIENSLDAGADRIEIEVEGNGARPMRIIDNGTGMDEDDVLLSLERHGTSKIKSDDDLAAISSLGFRGEALPSIASVSRMTITSRQTGDDLGNQVIVNYGKLFKVHQVGCGLGTMIEVRNLFGNTPARRKFLKTARTELGHIEEIVKNYCLGAKDVTFILRINNRETVHLEKGLSLEQRLGQIMNYNGKFMKVTSDPTGHAAKRSINGYLIPPDEGTIGGRSLRLFVNDRVVKDRLTTHAVAEGLRGFLMKGRNPTGFLELRLPAEEVDVNVHPAKHEVRFHNSRDIHRLISQTVAGTMRNRQQQLQNTIFGTHEMREDEPVPIEKSFVTDAPLFDHPVACADNNEQPAISTAPATSYHEPRQETINQPGNSSPILQTREPDPVIHKDLSPASTCDPGNDKRKSNEFLRVIGQYKDLYIFCQAGDTLLVIDQHAAHERLLYENLKKQHLDGKITAQSLLFPVTVELSLIQAQLVEQNCEELSRMGFQVRDFGGNSFIISAIPALAGQSAPAELFFDILAQFGDDSGKREGTNRLNDILASLACKAAVKSGDRLHGKEVDDLLAQMARADLFSHCPHGRPVVKQFSDTDVKKWFHRT